MVQDANCRLNVSRDPGRRGQIGLYVRSKDPGSGHALSFCFELRQGPGFTLRKEQ